MESGLKDVTEMVNMEKQRLQARTEAAESRVNELAEQIVQLQQVVNEKSIEYEQLKLASVQVLFTGFSDYSP